jgi:glycosyltransferase involved in cell wall biosynthesis
MGSFTMVSIIIPAFNEEAVIGRMLTHLLEGSDTSSLDIIVCCNGCKDRTEEIASSFGAPVRVLVSPKASKTAALNMGDAAARSFPRIYVDADIMLSYAAVQAIARSLTESTALAAAPRMRVDLSGRSWAIRAFYDIWLRTPYHTTGMIGSGVYALSETGRKRFDKFPEIIADDAFVRAQFAPSERKILDDCEFTIIPPSSLAALVKIKTRAALGTRELAIKCPDLVNKLTSKERGTDKASWLKKIAMQPMLWPKFAVYAGVKAIVAARARKQLKKLTDYKWARDETSRVEPAAIAVQ